jgi:hypothetical protein
MGGQEQVTYKELIDARQTVADVIEELNDDVYLPIFTRLDMEIKIRDADDLIEKMRLKGQLAELRRIWSKESHPHHISND